MHIIRSLKFFLKYVYGSVGGDFCPLLGLGYKVIVREFKEFDRLVRLYYLEDETQENKRKRLENPISLYNRCR